MDDPASTGLSQIFREVRHHVGAACPCQARAQGLLARHPNACLAMDFQFPCQVMEVFSQRRLSEVYLSSLGADEILSHAEKKPLGPCFGWTKPWLASGSGWSNVSG